MGKIVGLSFSSVKAALLAYIGLLEVDKAAFLSLVDVLGKNCWANLFFSESSFLFFFFLLAKDTLFTYFTKLHCLHHSHYNTQFTVHYLHP